MAGAGLVALSLILPHPAGGHLIALIATASGMALVGLVCWFASARVPLALTHLLLAGTALVTAVLIWESGLAVGQYGTIFTWATLISAYFFSRRTAAFHLGWLLVVYAGSLAVVENTGRLLAGHPLHLRRRLAHRGDALRQQPGRPPQPRRRPRPPLLRPLPGHALHDGPTGALHRGQRRLGAQPRLPPGRDPRQATARLHPPRGPRARHRGGDEGLRRRRLRRARDAGQGQGRQLALAAHQLRLRAGRGTRLRPLDRRHRAQTDQPRNART